MREGSAIPALALILAVPAWIATEHFWFLAAWIVGWMGGIYLLGWAVESSSRRKKFGKNKLVSFP
jgi:hypothetical protein